MPRHPRRADDLTLVGIALGAYGLTQACLQIPFGMASDRYGRKRVIVARPACCSPWAVSWRRWRDDIYMIIVGALSPGRGRDFGGGHGAGRGPHARAAPHQGDGDDRLEHRPGVRRFDGRSRPLLYAAIGMAGHLRAHRRAGAGGDRVVLIVVPCRHLAAWRATTVRALHRRAAGSAAAAPQLRHLLPAPGADGDVRRRAGRSGGSGGLPVSPSTGRSICRWCWRASC